MTNPLLYDIKRTLTSKSVLILMVVMIIFGLAIIPGFSNGIGPGSNFANTQVFTYYDTSGYHFLGFAWNQFGQPVSGVSFQANLSLSQPQIFFGGPPTTVSSPMPVYRTSAAATNSSGLADFSLSAPLNSSYYVSVNINQSNGFSNSFSGSSQPYLQFVKNNSSGKEDSIPPGQTVALFGSVISPVVDSTNSTLQDLQVTWVGPSGSLPANYAVYYMFINQPPPVCQGGPSSQTCTQINFISPSSLNESSMKLLGKMGSSYTQIFPLPTLEPNLSSAAEIALGLFYPNGTSASSSSFFNVQQLYPQPQLPISIEQGNSLVIQFFESLFGLFIPLMAIVGSFNSYGKDRVSGVLESVLSQPISRRGLALSRFISSFAAMAIAVSAAVAVVDIIVFHYTGSFVDTNVLVSSTAAFFVELAAFIGIMMLFSHVVSSSGALIGIGIGLFAVIDFFWGIIISLLLAFTNAGSYSVSYFQDVIIGEFVNPAQFVGLIDTYLTHQASFVGISPFSFPVTPSAYGVTIPSIVATGILWVALPLAIFLYLAIKRD